MYINTGYEITNTPTNIVAGYNTWNYYTPNWYQKVPRYYRDYTGQVQKWDYWNPPQVLHIAGGMYKGTPTRTGGFYAQNIVINPQQLQNMGAPCSRQ
jgi:hypothetical protein